MRTKLNTTGSWIEIVVQMAEGNPGAATVLGMLLRENMEGFRAILDLDDMNIRGSQIWIAYKYYCKEDLPVLMKAVFDQEPKLVEEVNEQCSIDPPERAVCSGASYSYQEVSDAQS